MRVGLADLLEELPGVTTYDYVPGNVSTPAVVVGWPTIDYLRAFKGGVVELEVPVTVVVGSRDDAEANRQLDEFMSYPGSRSVKAQIESESTLGGSCDDCVVASVQPQPLTVADKEYLSAVFTVRVFSTG